ncbi:NAD(P)/FAD-dependent oxidoreductase [Candidatus Harpocratesius sp.]
MTNYDLIIIGAGPAGLTAAIYSSRAKLRVLVIDMSTAGGQVKTTHQVANFPGFIEPIPGYKLAQNMYKQAQLYGTEFKLISNIKELHLSPKEKWVTLTSGEKYEAPFFILATGRSPRMLNLPGEKELAGNGISYCATCDGDFYKGKDIFVIGGGNSAMEESLLLLQLVNSITVIHQFDELQAEKITAEKVKKNPKATFMYSHEPRKFEAVNDKIAVEIENLKTHERITLERDGVFIFVGMIPNNEIIKGTGVKLNKYGYISTNEQTMETNIPGVYAAGDIRDKFQWQITTAVSDGTIAALDIIKHQ